MELIPDYCGIARLYAEAVASKRLPTNRLLVAAADRYLRMLDMARDPHNEFIFSPMHVIDYCRFAEKLRHFESGSWEFTQIGSDGKPDPKIILEPFQIWVEAAIQGFRRRLTGERLVSTALEILPRKNAKSLKATVAALFDLCCCGDNAEVPIAAATQKQSEDTLFGDIIKMVNNEPELREQYGLKVTKEEISRGDGKIFMLSSQGERQDGLNPSLAIFEEGHAGAASVYAVVESAFGARPNALKRMITTAGYKPEGPGYDLLQEAKLVLEGKAEDWTLFAAIYTLDKEDYINPESKAVDYDKLFGDEDLIYKCNPMMDVGLDIIKIRSAISKARRIPSKRRETARTRFNLWVGSGTSLIEAHAWAACKRNISIENYIGRRCWIGVDLAQVKDMCAVILLFEEPTGEIVVFGKFYLPELSETASNPEISEHLAAWHEAEHLVLTPGPLADHDLVREDVEAFCDVFDVVVVACDPHQAHNTVKHLWDGNRPVMTYPNMAPTMTPPWDDIEGRIASERIWHDGNPVLAWMMQNVHGDRKGNGLILPRKETKESIRKIDGAVALCFANGCRLEPGQAKTAGPEPETIDPYKLRGIIGFEEMMNG